MAQGDLTEALTWIEPLPDDLVAARPRLAVEKAWAMAFAGDPGAVVSLLADAESHGEGTARLRGHIAAIRAFIAVAMGEGERALTLADQADDLLDEDEAWARSVMAWSRGYTYRMIGALTRAEPAFRALVAYGKALDNVWTPVTGYTELTLLLHAQGRLGEALEAARAGLTVAQAGPSGQRRIPGYAGRLESALATVLWARNELEVAAQHAAAGIEQTPVAESQPRDLRPGGLGTHPPGAGRPECGGDRAGPGRGSGHAPGGRSHPSGDGGPAEYQPPAGSRRPDHSSAVG